MHLMHGQYYFIIISSLYVPTEGLGAYPNGSDSDGSPNRRRLVRNQSEGSPKSDGELRRLADVTARRRTDYGVIGDAACMGDHKVTLL
ncbi:hypothetical protein RR48_00229 [Papilio machaon]|uniref:Uncharacterized protein n=1 Tax=Papilio machaon TaxID=76193 RepID=A0A0N1II35_PAPMA|nr:hypothetical protein RR48_00229 [Papilio machaon]